MKTGNFPGMKAERRKGALERIEARLETLKGMSGQDAIAEDHGNRFVLVSAERGRLMAEADKLRERVANVTWFTKKHRGG